MAQKVKTNDQGEVLGRNQAIACLKSRLKPHGIRIDLAEVFAERRSYELLSVYFDPTTEEGSQKHLFVPKTGFLELVKDATLVEKFPRLLPKPPAVIYVPADVLCRSEASALSGDACSPA